MLLLYEESDFLVPHEQEDCLGNAGFARAKSDDIAIVELLPPLSKLFKRTHKLYRVVDESCRKLEELYFQ